MLSDIVVSDLRNTRGTSQLINIPLAERVSGVRIVGICDNGESIRVFVASSDPNSLETMREVCERQVARNVRVESDPIFLKYGD